LPAPLGPSTPNTSPGCTCRSTRSTARTAPKSFVNPRVSIAGHSGRCCIPLRCQCMVTYRFQIRLRRAGMARVQACGDLLGEGMKLVGTSAIRAAGAAGLLMLAACSAGEFSPPTPSSAPEDVALESPFPAVEPRERWRIEFPQDLQEAAQ